MISDMNLNEILKIESEIDSEFDNNPLTQKGYNFDTLAWIILSIVEVYHFEYRAIQKPSIQELEMFIDGMLNALSYPLRVSLKFKDTSRSKENITAEDLQLALDWINQANDYNQFNSIFPLFHRKQLDLTVDHNSKTIYPSNWKETELSFEYYDRTVRGPGTKSSHELDSEYIARLVSSKIDIFDDAFIDNMDSNIIHEIYNQLLICNDHMFELPLNWEFKYFSLDDFKYVFFVLKSIATYRYYLLDLIYINFNITPKLIGDFLLRIDIFDLYNIIHNVTNVQLSSIKKIVEYMTFGEVGIRDPDIAIQPLIKLADNKLAISSFLLMSVNAERNLLILLNKITYEKKLYQALSNQKEKLLIDNMISTLSKNKKLRFEFIKNKKINNTEIDLAIIDRLNKICLVIELKWFIEPADIREVIERSVEISKGIKQAKTILKLWEDKNESLIKQILNIDSSYLFLPIVGSVTSIGTYSVQDERIPVIKIHHLIEKINMAGKLKPVIRWLEKRLFIPKEGVDFEVLDINFSIGNWNCSWYGTRPLKKTKYYFLNQWI